MGEVIDQRELRRRAFAGIRHEVEAFGSGDAGSRLIEGDGLLAALVPAAPERSIFNSVYYERPAALAAELPALAQAYEGAGVRAWTVWVPDEDRESAARLAALGHSFDGEPRAMALRLADLRAAARPAPPGVSAGPGEPATAAALNDRAYGYEQAAFAAAFTGETRLRWRVALAGGEAVSCVGTIDVGDDCCVSGVATAPEWMGRGLASWLLHGALEEARDRGCLTANLRASRAGAPVYERLGFADLGHVELWELRR
jgi:GNAT superfamily N-acetyltransferase